MKVSCKKIISGAVAALCAFSVSATAFAETTGKDVPENGETTVLVNGTAEQTIIRVTVPTSLTFAITPNADVKNGEKIFNSVSAAVTNNTMAPIDLKLMNVKAAEGNKVKVVEENTYADNETLLPSGKPAWGKIGTKPTESQIALGLKQGTKGETFWSHEEKSADDTAAGTFKIVANDGTTPGKTDISIQAKHGNAWTGDIKEIAYDLTLRVGLSETTPEVVE